ncbi:hypothetical protein WH47_10064 [Habropoda laboriosa]|uniref:Uncharacterized protein n=1 Tax=Habropoda laboriosa TaxID=597456 RepID=A0A0L7R3S8_9HYME|nr:hypothetical protein WH47_10064 [Habropoda laboriosa]
MLQNKYKNVTHCIFDMDGLLLIMSKITMAIVNKYEEYILNTQCIYMSGFYYQ